MILERLSIHGFSSAFRASTAVLDFEPLGPGVYAWCGPNGAGKTTAMESVAAALYREFPSYGYHAKNHVAPGVRDALIELTVRLAGARWRLRLMADPMVDGGRGKTEHYLDRWVGEAWDAKAGPAVHATDLALSQLVPTRDLFLAGPFAAQRGAGSFWSLAKADRKRLFVELLGHGKLQLLHGRAVEQSKACGVDLAALTAEVERLNDLAIKRADLVERLAMLADALAERTAGAGAIADELAEARRRAENARAAVVAAEAEHKAASNRFLDRCQALEVASKAVRDAEGAYMAAQKAATKAEPPPYDGPTIEEAREIVAEAEARRATAATVASEAQARHLAAQQAAARAGAALDQLERDVAAAVAAMVLDGVDLERDICQACPLTQRAREAGSLHARLVAELSPTGVASRAAVQEEGAAAVAAASTAARLLELEGDVKNGRVALDMATGAAMTEARHREASTYLDRCRADLDTARARREEAQAAAHEATPPEGEDVGLLHRAAQDTARAVADLEQRARLLDDARREAERDHARAEGELAAIDKAIGGADIHEKQDALLRLQARRRAWSLLEVGLGPVGVQALEIDAAGPEVSQLANDLLVDCYGPRFQIRLETTRPLKSKDGQAEVFECAVIDAEADHSTHAGSGGEMVIVEEALRLALAIYSTRQSGRECLTLFRDEAAGALDQWPGRDSAARYLAMLRAARERGGFHHVHFIAHQPALFDAADGRFVFGAGAVRFEEG